jgi:tetratricopeptide (TPR) repeat protein
MLCLKSAFAYAQDASDYLKSANIFYEKGDYEGAIADFTKAVELSPNNEEAYYGRGLMFWIQGKESESTDDFKKAAQLNPKFEEIFLDLSNASKFKNDVSKFTYDIKINHSAKAYFDRGFTYAQHYIISHSKSEYHNALEDYNKAIELDPKNKEFYLNRDVLISMK